MKCQGCVFLVDVQGAPTSGKIWCKYSIVFHPSNTHGMYIYIYIQTFNIDSQKLVYLKGFIYRLQPSFLDISGYSFRQFPRMQLAIANAGRPQGAGTPSQPERGATVQHAEESL